MSSFRVVVGLLISGAWITWGQPPVVGRPETKSANPANGLVTAATYPTGPGPFLMALGDFNGDGKADLAVADSGSNQVSILLGNGDGTFQAKADYPTGSEPLSVAVADLNGDGRADLVIGNQVSNNASVLLGNGDGTFQAAINFDVGVVFNGVGGLTVVDVADVNGDGKPDLIVGNAVNSNISILLGNGNGTFQPAMLSASSNPDVLALGDFNGDGKVDYAAGSLSGVFTYLGNGDGTFRLSSSASTGNGAIFLASGDLNGDGKLDIAAANSSGVSVLLGKGDGTFATAVNYPAGASPQFVMVGDINGDGKLDLITTNPGTNNISVLLGRGDGTFQPPVLYAVGAQPIGAVVGDFNGDGRTDMAVANHVSNNITVLLGVLSPVLGVTKTHTGNFMSGQAGSYSIVVSNAGPGTPSGTITVTDSLPAGLAATGMGGAGWNCVLGTVTCTRSDALSAGTSYPAITLMVSVASNAPPQAVNQVSVSGGGAVAASASDPTTILPSATTPSVLIDAPAGGATVSGTVTVTGWAIDSTSAVGSPITGVQVKVDGVTAGNATYGTSRPDVCNVFPGRPNCPNVGYTFALNTAALSGGAHTITVLATNSDVTPGVGSASVIVTVPGAAGRINLTVWRPVNGTWYVNPASGPQVTQQWGLQGDIPVSGDYDHDGIPDYAVWRPVNGTWYVILSSNPGSPIVQQWGLPGDIPVPGDYDGDGKTDFAVWRPSNGTWYIIPSGNPGSPIVKQWGLTGDIPVVADFDGDHRADFVVWRPREGNWYITPSGNPGGAFVRQWGLAGDSPVAADYDGDGKADFAVWRPANGTWYVIPSGNPGGPVQAQWGLSGDIAVPKDYDRDGKVDFAVWRPVNGTWYVIPSTNPGAPLQVQWGLANDVPAYKPTGN